MKPLHHLLILFSLICCSIDVNAQSINNEQVNNILQTADGMCGSFAKSGQSSKQTISGEATARLNGLLRQLTDLGIEGIGEFNSSEYVNVKQEQLADELLSIRECKLEIWRDLTEAFSVFSDDSSGLQTAMNIDRIQRQIELDGALYNLGTLDSGEYIISDFIDSFDNTSQSWNFSVLRTCSLSLADSHDNDIRYRWTLKRSTGSIVVSRTTSRKNKTVGHGDYELVFDIDDGKAGFYSATVNVRCR